MQRYNPKEIEAKWQKIWDETGTYTADLNSDKPKYIAMSMFNYPSGAGIHIGHAMNYTISDVKARFKRQQGFESYHPVGWDAFGLPAENYAIKAGVSPQESMATIIPGYHKQYKAMGWSNDWEKEIATHLPEYYKWTQWIFAQMYEHGLAYQDSRLQWYCEIDNTVLANEQVIDGKCWRHDGPDDPLVQKKEIKQWFFKITEYADELLEAIDELDWTESVKLAQKNWIGKSTGAEITFAIDSHQESLTVFTTRPDTLFGVTFMVLAPEHEALAQITTSAQKSAVDHYVAEAAKKSEVERQASKEKTGVFTGAYAINPANGAKIPIWVADYVLGGYGTGAIMAVPGHDERDYAFARKFDLPVIRVVDPVTGEEQENPVTKAKIVCVVQNDAGEILTINWKPELGGRLLVGGGIEEGEEPAETAKREIAEETGYTDIELVEVADETVFHEYYAFSKKLPVRAVTSLVHYKLKSDTQVPTAHEATEKGNFTVEWVKPGVAAREIHDEQHLRALDRFVFDQVYHGEGLMANSGKYDGLPSAEAREKIVKDLEKSGQATEKVNYRMNDWSVSRQRYWGAPIPIINCPKDGAVLVPEAQLPVTLPELDDFQPSGDGRSALARATDWLEVECPKCGGKAERETDTLDTYICSSWYFLRYFDPYNQQAAFSSDLANKWMPIDFYNGADHATAHMLYARFVTRFFTKIGLLDNPEPFKQFLFNGKVTASDGSAFSKSKGNGVDPLDIINQGYGADALRTFLMFAAPLELGARWDPQGVPATYRFISRVWNLVQEYNESQSIDLSAEQQAAIYRAVHRMIKKTTEDIEANRYNTAIAALMEVTNDLYKVKAVGFGQHDVWHQALADVVACMAPFAPHAAEELWHQLDHSTTVHKDTWPKFDEKYLAQDTITVVVQVNGKLRGDIQVEADADEATVAATAQAHDKVTVHLEGQTIKKTIYVPGKLINFVI
ncbi:MAG TPA: class I tRNA ligase family protein [Candidatus Saccharimonadales bacterium]|nr:class I tRNA ligase family protein [Candidatus Saccharimonadales bacterium]